MRRLGWVLLAIGCERGQAPGETSEETDLPEDTTETSDTSDSTTGDVDADDDGVPLSEDCDDGDPTRWLFSDLPEDLQSPTQIASFCEHYCGRPVNNLVVGSQVGPDLSSLECVTNIYGDVVIQDSALVNFVGLDNVSRIEGTVRISNNPSLANFSGLEHLRSVGHFEVAGNASLISFDGLDELDSIEGDFQVINNPALLNFTGLENLGWVAGELNIESNDQLLNLEGLESLEHVDSHLTIHSNAVLATTEGLGPITSLVELHINKQWLLTDLAGFDTLAVLGSLELADTGVTSLAPLADLTSVHHLEIRNSLLTDLDGLQGLTHIPGGLTLESNQQLTNVEGLNSLEELGSLDIRHSYALQTLEGLESLESLGALHLFRTNLTTLAALSSLTSVPGSIILDGNSALWDLTGLEGITHCEGLWMYDNSALQSVHGLENLEIVDNTISLCGGEDSLQSLQGFESLTTVGRLIISGCNELQTLAGLENLETIQYSLDVSGIPSLTSINGLSGLRTVGEDVTLIALGISEVSALSGVESIGGMLAIQYNPQLSGTETNALVTAIGTENIGLIQIDNNAN